MRSTGVNAGAVWGAAAIGVMVIAGAGAGLLQDGEAIVAPVATGMASREPVDFDRDIAPILQARCWECHGTQKRRGGLRLDSSAAVLAGGKTGPAAVVGKSAESLLIQLVSGEDPDRIMPDEGPRLTAAEIALLKAWIDEGMTWGTTQATSLPHVYELALKKVTLPPASAAGGSEHPIDRLVAAAMRESGGATVSLVDDRTFIRRATLDVVGLLPDPERVDGFVADKAVDKRAVLVRSLLADSRGYAEHWLTFWNDALRNDYAGTGYIDGGREQITQWLFDALYADLPYDRFVSELVSPTSKASEGFAKGIVWRGVVNASQVPPMQAAQNVSQVFLGLNLKCASCHDSFINDWKLSDAYSMAAIFSDGPLEVSRCDQPQGTTAKSGFLYPQLGSIDGTAPREARQRRLSELLVSRENGRFTRTIVNRLWAKLMGRGIVEPVDEMDNPPWSADLLDYLAADLVEHGYDVKRTLELIMTSRAYQMAASPGAEKFDSAAPFRGPVVRRMSAEQFVDAVRSVIDVWPAESSAHITVAGQEGAYPGKIRAGLLVADPLTMALGRPNRDQVVTSRPSAATTLQAIELTNGAVLDGILAQGAKKIVQEAAGAAPVEIVNRLYRRALGREARPEELAAGVELVQSPETEQGVQDLLWAITMLPEFQIIR